MICSIVRRIVKGEIFPAGDLESSWVYFLFRADLVPASRSAKQVLQVNVDREFVGRYPGVFLRIRSESGNLHSVGLEILYVEVIIGDRLLIFRVELDHQMVLAGRGGFGQSELRFTESADLHLFDFHRRIAGIT